MFGLKHEDTNVIAMTRSASAYTGDQIPDGCVAVEFESLYDDDGVLISRMCTGDTLVDGVLTKEVIDEYEDSGATAAFAALDTTRDRAAATDQENAAWDIDALLKTIKLLKERL